LSLDAFSDEAAKRGVAGVVIGPLAEGAPPPALRWQDFAAICLGVPLQALLSGVAKLRPFLIEDHEDLERFPRTRFKAWLAREKPDVIVTMATDLIERVLAGEGLHIPGDIGLAALSCPERGHRYSGVYQNGHFIGATAIDLLVGMIERRETGLPEQAIATMVEGVWNPGTTLRDMNAVADAPQPALAAV
jgi:DNA-binding LacI/PurR family transcriptional regulator